MPTPATERQQDNAGLGGAAKQVAEHASTLARLEMELATIELKQKIAALGMGIGMALGAAVFLLFFLGFLFAGIAALIGKALGTWAAQLLVAGGLLAVAIVLGLLALKAIRRGSPPVPEQAIQEAKTTQEALKSDGTA